MLYSIVSHDTDNSLTKRQTARPAHLARIQALQAQNRLVLAGPNPIPNQEGFSGSIIIASFDSLQAAQEWANSDPYFEAGAYSHSEVKPFKKVLP